ncbi:MAG: hypothetical protein JO242_00640 [Streptosporangiaceae bacterium]|nr:hypothetical protein [Streptosporangiaceae bacterium]
MHVDELRNPGREYPKSIFLAMALVLAVFIGPTLAIAWVIPANQISFTAGVMQAFQSLFTHFGAGFAVPLIAIGAIRPPEPARVRRPDPGSPARQPGRPAGPVPGALSARPRRPRHGGDHGAPDRQVHHDQPGGGRCGRRGGQRQGQRRGQRRQRDGGPQGPGVRGAPLQQGEQQPAEQAGSHGDADDLAHRDRLGGAGAEAEVQVDAEQRDFHGPGQGGGQGAARGAQRPGAAVLDGRHGGGGGEHVRTPSGGSRRPVAPLLTRLSRAGVIGHRLAGARCAAAPAVAGTAGAVARPPARRRWRRPAAGNTLPVMGINHRIRLPRRWRGAAGVALVLVLAVAGGHAEANPVHRYGGLHLAGHPPLAAYLLLGVPALALIWRNSRPVGVLGLAVAGAAGWAALGQIDGAALVPVIVALYWVALTRPWRIAVAAGLAGAAAIFVTEGLAGPFGWFGGPNATMWPELLAAGAVGGYVAARRQWLAAESDRAARAEQAREDETRRRIDAERMRIARELHDVVAHSMAMINIQATAAGMQLAADPAGAGESIQAIRAASKSGLRELRAILEVLRQADGGSPAVPVPDLRAITALAEAASAAGTPTTLEPAGPPAPVPPPVALAAYRIVQESLTNVVRHAGRVAATVGLRHDGRYLYVEVANDGGAAPAASSDGTGAGLAGMRERAAALGGTLDAGPRPGGGFAVRARLPMAAAAPARGPQALAAGPASAESTGSQAAGRQPADGGPHGRPIASRP